MTKSNLLFAALIVVSASGSTNCETAQSLPGKQDAQDSAAWSIDSGLIDPHHYYGEIVANGMIGILSAPAPFRAAQILLNGAYEPLEPGGVDALLRTLNFLDLRVAIDGDNINRIEQTTRFHQTLDMKRAMLVTEFGYQDKATVTTTLRALRQLPYTAMLEVAVVTKKPITLSVADTITSSLPPEEQATADARQSLTDFASFEREIPIGNDADRKLFLSAASAKGPQHRVTLAAAQSFIFDEAADQKPALERLGDGQTFTRRIAAGSRFHFAVVGATISSAHTADPVSEAQRLTASAWVQGSQSLIAKHEAAWADLWKSDIRIEGDEVTQLDVHSMLYHLYSFIREDSDLSISPMGLSRSAGGYLGHIFWDAETWMLPVLVALHPNLARSMLEYRYRRLLAAQKTAIANGYRGAEFPWESAESGSEDTPLCCTPFEIHITADVGIAAWSYYRATQDREWLCTRGYPLLEETADFWTSRASRNAAGRYDIEHVLAADEYANDVANDAYTNAAARENLLNANAAARILGLAPHSEWAEVRKGIPILTFSNGITREHANYHGEMIKQADVNLLAYPLSEITNPRVIRGDLEYYGSRVDQRNGPAMTKSVLATLYERLGMPEEAYKLFKSGYEPNKRPPFGAIAETAGSDNPYFATGAGGLLQTVLYGFGGLTLTDRGFIQKTTKLPAAWKSLTLIGIGTRQEVYTVK
jgi:protein-glucosylgalactosylhydroxylysine glucosidase